jgi:alpha-beta hydrolase superfamily lysophospholipase
MKKRRKVVVDSVTRDVEYPHGGLFYKIRYRYVGGDDPYREDKMLVIRHGDTDELAAYMRFVRGMADAGVDVVTEEVCDGVS